MKNKLFFSIFFLWIHSQIAFSQATDATPGSGNIWNAGEFLGYNASNGFNPLFFKTNNVFRMRLNGNELANIGGSFAVNTFGFVGISPAGTFGFASPWAMMHLEGPGVYPPTAGGWRKWMRTGMFAREETDNMYVGMKRVGTDRCDAVISWSDNQDGPFGPDRLKFIYTNGADNGDGDAPQVPINSGAFEGYEAMRMESSINQVNTEGTRPIFVGVGPVFGTAATDRPQSRLHLNSEENLTNWLQMSIQNVTGQFASDGLRFGVLGQQSAFAADGNALLYQQELRHLLFSTNANTNTLDIDLGVTRERMRITSINTPTNLPSGGYATYIPPGSVTPSNRTRVSISHDPSVPLTRPMSLLHLGYNVGGGSASVDGWRPWMDIGTFIGTGTDNMYIGMKNEGSPDRNDAVINWGDNLIPGGAGPDNLRFIFTSIASGGIPPAIGPNGMEGGRMTPTLVNGVFTGIGGDPTSNPYNGGVINPTNTLEVNAWNALTTTPGGASGLRFTNLQAGVSPPITNPGTGVLSVTSSGDVIYVDANAGTGIGNYCGATLNPLTGDYEVPLNDFVYRFTGQSAFDPILGSQLDAVSIGYACSTAVPAKLNILQEIGASTNLSTTATSSINRDVSTVSGTIYRGVHGISNGLQPINLPIVNVGGDFVGNDAFTSIGVRGIANFGTQGAKQAFGGAFSATGANTLNVGVVGQANNGTGDNIAVRGTSIGTSGVNYGGYFDANSSTTANYGIFAQVPASFGGSGPDYAGYFDGDVVSTGFVTPSDANLKQNIDSIPDAISIIFQLQPRTFDYDTAAYPQMSLSRKKQYGFIAQEVQTVLPELIGSAIHPAVTDTNGIVITPAVNYKTLNYNALFAIMMKGIQEQQSKIDSLQNDNNAPDSINEALQNQINTLADAIESCCSSAHSMNTNNSNSTVATDVELRDAQSIVLEQNVPNPFAEQTTINYFLPDNVVKAQMLFYNASGRLIQSVDLNEKGKGQLNVFANDLTNGIYTYSLIVDGKIFETKKMIKQ